MSENNYMEDKVTLRYGNAIRRLGLDELAKKIVLKLGVGKSFVRDC